MRVALVYDRVNKWGGAERVLLALHEIWPQAPLFTAVYEPRKAPWASVFDVRASFLNYLPFARSYHELYPWLTPLAFETFNFDEFNVVISVTSAEAKGIITKPQTLHICYCLTPTRYLWSGYEGYLKNPGLGGLDGLGGWFLKRLAPTLRKWDRIVAERPDYYIGISEHVAKRIKKYYGRDSKAIIYPPVNVEQLMGKKLRWIPGPFAGQRARNDNKKRGGYFLVVSRLVGYKRVDLIIDAFNKLGWPLVIIGDGLMRRELKNQAGKTITFITRHLTDAELARYYEDCRALIIAADEDFGIGAVEAQAFGKPVIAFKHSGVAESVLDGKTGLLFAKHTSESLMEALRRFEKMKFDKHVCQKNAEKFSKERFKEEMKTTVNKLYNDRSRAQ